jgi:hypothetical protein
MLIQDVYLLGCIFVLFPRTEFDKKSMYYGMESRIETVNLREHPEQLYRVITTTENINRVGDWLQEAGFSKEYVVTYDEFLNIMRNERKLQEERQKESLDNRISVGPDIKQEIQKRSTELFQDLDNGAPTERLNDGGAPTERLD